MADAADDTFETLLDAMPRIAEAVKVLPTPELQSKAFDALVAAHQGGGQRAAPAAKPATARKRTNTRKRSAADEPGESKPRRRAGRSTASQIRDLDLAPKGKKSLKDFVAQKQPKSQHERNVAAVYYLKEIAGVSPVTVDHVYTCYRDQGWPLPADPGQALRLTATKKRFLDTGDRDDIRLTSTGTNYVEHELPKPAKK
jgi:hypothetical protein